jgi:hypothetical protein
MSIGMCLRRSIQTPRQGIIAVAETKDNHYAVAGERGSLHAQACAFMVTLVVRRPFAGDVKLVS